MKLVYPPGKHVVPDAVESDVLQEKPRLGCLMHPLGPAEDRAKLLFNPLELSPRSVQFGFALA
jgi:hypothetical protein